MAWAGMIARQPGSNCLANPWLGGSWTAQNAPTAFHRGTFRTLWVYHPLLPGLRVVRQAFIEIDNMDLLVVALDRADPPPSPDC